MSNLIYPTKSEAVKALCAPRWEGWTPKSKKDPCGGCVLYDPCINKGVTVPGLEAFTKWIEGMNHAAEVLG